MLTVKTVNIIPTERKHINCKTAYPVQTSCHSDKPQLIDTPKGLSVFYKNKYLYSRYAPATAAEQLCTQLQILPGTLIICFSPLLFYGVKTLLSRLNQQSRLVFIEADPALYEVSLNIFNNLFPQQQTADYELVVSADRLSDLLTRAENPDNPLYLGNYRRCIFLNLSGGVFLHEQTYQNIKKTADEWLSRFWKNRVTLIKMGKLYARNLLRNLALLPNSFVLSEKSEHRPIIVFGAGPSTDTVLNDLQKTDWQKHRHSFCFLAVDSALVPLLQRGIRPDAVIALESQLANEQAFIGAAGSRILLISDLTARPAITRITGGNTAFICSRYAKTTFLTRVEQLIPQSCSFDPLGSVGLAALETALLLRATQETPIFFSGLDFSYLPGKTHCREAPAHKRALNTHNRLETLENPASAYRRGSFFIPTKSGQTAVCDPALEGYGKLCAARYAHQPQVFTLSQFGMHTGFSFFCPKNLITKYGGTTFQKTDKIPLKEKKNVPNNDSEKIRAFLITEQNALNHIKHLLESRTNDKEALKLIKEREYLFLHFPDGHIPPRCDESFFNRVRGELGVFLKDIGLSIHHLESEEQKT